MLSRKLILLAVLTLAFLNASCGSEREYKPDLSEKINSIEENLDIANIEGNVRFFLTDAPIDDVAEVNVAVHGLRIKSHQETLPVFDDQVEELEDDSDNRQPKNKKGWQSIIFDEPILLNLLELQDGLSSLLGDLELAPGLYKEIRLMISESEVVLQNGESEKLKIPGGKSDGLKIKFKGDGLQVEEDSVYVLVIDFDIHKSLKRKGHKIKNDSVMLSKKDDDAQDKHHAKDKKEKNQHAAKQDAVNDGEEDDAHEQEKRKKHRKKKGPEHFENKQVEGRSWILKPVIKVLYLAEVNDSGSLDIQMVDEEEESVDQAEESDDSDDTPDISDDSDALAEEEESINHDEESDDSDDTSDISDDSDALVEEEESDDSDDATDISDDSDVLAEDEE